MLYATLCSSWVETQHKLGKLAFNNATAAASLAFPCWSRLRYQHVETGRSKGNYILSLLLVFFKIRVICRWRTYSRLLDVAFKEVFFHACSLRFPQNDCQTNLFLISKSLGHEKYFACGLMMLPHVSHDGQSLLWLHVIMDACLHDGSFLIHFNFSSWHHSLKNMILGRWAVNAWDEVIRQSFQISCSSLPNLLVKFFQKLDF